MVMASLQFARDPYGNEIIEILDTMPKLILVPKNLKRISLLSLIHVVSFDYLDL